MWPSANSSLVLADPSYRGRWTRRLRPRSTPKQKATANASPLSTPHTPSPTVSSPRSSGRRSSPRKSSSGRQSSPGASPPPIRITPRRETAPSPDAAQFQTPSPRRSSNAQSASTPWSSPISGLSSDSSISGRGGGGGGGKSRWSPVVQTASDEPMYNLSAFRDLVFDFCTLRIKVGRASERTPFMRMLKNAGIRCAPVDDAASNILKALRGTLVQLQTADDMHRYFCIVQTGHVIQQAPPL